MRQFQKFVFGQYSNLYSMLKCLPNSIMGIAQVLGVSCYTIRSNEYSKVNFHVCQFCAKISNFRTPDSISCIFALRYDNILSYCQIWCLKTSGHAAT